MLVKRVLEQFHRMRATNPGDKALLGLFFVNAHNDHISHASLVKVVEAGVFLHHAAHSVLQGAIGIPPFFLLKNTKKWYSLLIPLSPKHF